jgi:hypothetical protein
MDERSMVLPKGKHPDAKTLAHFSRGPEFAMRRNSVEKDRFLDG